MLIRLFIPALLLIATPVGAQTTQPQEPQQVVVTSGEGVVHRAPDRAYVVIAAESRARTPQEAQGANTDAMTAVTARIKAAGIPSEAIQTISYSLQPEFDYANGKQTLRDYVARNQVQVRVDELGKLGDILAAAVATGATNIGGIRFDLKDRAGAERSALQMAVADARARAEAAVSGAGMHVDRIVRIEEQREVVGPRSYQPMAAAPMAQRAEVAVPIESGEIEIHAHVTLTAAIR